MNVAASRFHVPAVLLVATVMACMPRLYAQGRGASAPPASGRQSAPADLTGNWVAYVTEDWRFRMITPPRGDYTRVPLTAEGRKVADGWNPQADVAAGEQCRAYGAAALMRVPARFRIAWQGDNTLTVESDAGMQRRTLQFGSSSPPGERSWQGISTARWENGSRTLVVTTTNLRPGYLRRNGVPYSADARVTEYLVVAPYLRDEQVLIVTTSVEDPRYLQRPFVVSSHFKRDKDPSKWNPAPCVATW
jgi:hypothetical protein